MSQQVAGARSHYFLSTPLGKIQHQNKFWLSFCEWFYDEVMNGVFIMMMICVSGYEIILWREDYIFNDNWITAR